jgi:hypothetical protein
MCAYLNRLCRSGEILDDEVKNRMKIRASG